MIRPRLLLSTARAYETRLVIAAHEGHSVGLRPLDQMLSELHLRRRRLRKLNSLLLVCHDLSAMTWSFPDRINVLAPPWDRRRTTCYGSRVAVLISVDVIRRLMGHLKPIQALFVFRVVSTRVINAAA
ncbi:hypothetical protein AB0869_24400 [Micromonospora vinacea]|uniref:hypothetical protein n=1 Tax=Micromonospora vinacea TaxID=709878 RepID=UPI0034562154